MTIRDYRCQPGLRTDTGTATKLVKENALTIKGKDGLTKREEHRTFFRETYHDSDYVLVGRLIRENKSFGPALPRPNGTAAGPPAPCSTAPSAPYKK